MKIKNAFAVAAVMAALSAQALATEYSIVNTTVSGVQPDKDGKFYITVVGNNANCTNASSPKRYQATVGQNGMTQEGLNLLFTLALTAVTTEQTVTLFFEGGSSCFINRIAITN